MEGEQSAVSTERIMSWSVAKLHTAKGSCIYTASAESTPLASSEKAGVLNQALGALSQRLLDDLV